MILAFEKSDIRLNGFLSGYLHDVRCSWHDETCFDEDQRTLIIHTHRIRHEEPHRGRILGLFRATRYQEVPADLVVKNVAHVSITPFRGRMRKHPFSFAEFIAEDRLSLEFEGAQIVAQLDGWCPVELRDVGSPSAKDKHCIIGGFLDDAFDAEVRARRIDD